MARKKEAAMAIARPSSSDESTQAVEDEPATKSARPARRRSSATKRSAGASRKGRQSKAARTARRGRPKTALRSSGPGRRVGRMGYTDQQRKQILSAARREGLTAIQVQKRFGVTPVTYYSWRKKSGVGRPRRARAVVAGAAVGRALGSAMNFADAIREQVRAHIRKILPEVIASEFGVGKRRAGRRPSR